jgi:hypothetical protein
MTKSTECIGSMVNIVPCMRRMSDAVLTCSEGPVVRITPDEVHVQEQFYNPNYAEGWIKGTEVLDAGRDQLRDTTTSFQIRNQVRSILQIEVRHIIRGLVRKHQVHRVFSSRIRSFFPIPELRGPQTDHTEGSDLENGSPTALLLARGRSMSRSSQECKGPLPTSGNTGPRLWYP